MENCCSICTDNFNKGINTPIRCPYCQFKSCLKCTKHYLLESINYPNCMSCKMFWNNDFLIDHFPKCFIFKEYARKKKELMFERELIYIKDTQDILLERKREKEIHTKINNLYQDIRNYKQKIKELSKQIDIYVMDLNQVKQINSEKQSHNNIQCIRDNCMGYLVQYKCPLCDIKVCSKCLCEKIEDHECDPLIVENVNLIKKECKNCPKCRVSIYKTEGCDQMWCTQCQIVFSWKSGEQLRNVNWIHNPHYLEHIRDENNTENDNHQNCPLQNRMRLPNYRNIAKLAKQYDKRDLLYMVYAQTGEMFDITLRQFERNLFTHDFNSFLNERINYMNHTITKQQFQDILIRKSKANDKFTDFYQIIHSYVMIIISIFNQLIHNDQMINDDNYLYQIKSIIFEYFHLYENSVKKYNSTYSNPLYELYSEFSLLPS